MSIRGVILAGGKGTRMGELTKVTNKHLLPVGPWPMVYHPLKKLTGAGLQDILLVSGTEHMGDFVELLGSGKRPQLPADLPRAGRGRRHRPGARAWPSTSARAAGRACCSATTSSATRSMPLLEKANSRPDWAWIGLKQVPDPGRYGVAELKGDKVIGIEEKPENPKSDFAVVGIYIYPPDVFGVIKTLKPSGRGELEITDVNNHYLKQGRHGLQHPRRLLDRRRHARHPRLRERTGAEGAAAVLATVA